MGIFTVENGIKAAAAFIADGVRQATTTVVASTAQRDTLAPLIGDQVMVLDRGNGEWELYLWDGSNWIVIANQDSARTDANSVAYTLTPLSPPSPLITTVSTESRITLITVEVITPFDGAPTLTIGDPLAPDKLMSDVINDLTHVGTYSAQTDVYYNSGSDTDIIAAFNPNGATVGEARIVVSYM